MKHWIHCAKVLVLLVAGCSSSETNRLPSRAETTLRGAERMELFALDPTPLSMSGGAPDTEKLHGYAITGHASLDDAAQRKQLADLILRGIHDSDGRVAACFNPRHGIRAVRADETLELVICFECLSMSAFGNALGEHTTRASALTSQSVEPAVTRIFNAAGLKIAGQE